jgi:hypothetical protein
MQLLSLSQRLEKERNETTPQSGSKASALPPQSSESSSGQQQQAASNLSNSSFTCLSEKTFTALIKSDLLNVTREIYVYYALNKWAEHQQQSSQQPASSQKLDQLYESLFKYIRLNGLSREELEFILKNDRFVQSNSNLLNRIQAYYSEIAAPPFSLMTSLFPSGIGCSNANITASNCASQLLKSSADLIGDFSSSSGMSANSKVSSSSVNGGNSKSRPSTIPREYLCMLHTDRFFFFDFYKSKWDSLTDSGGGGSSPVLNLSSASGVGGVVAGLSTNGGGGGFVQVAASAVTSSSVLTKRLNGYSTCLIDNILYVMGGYLIDSFHSQNDGYIFLFFLFVEKLLFYFFFNII